MIKAEQEKTTIFMIEDNEMFRFAMGAAIKLHPGFELIGQSASFDEAVPRLFSSRPQVVLMDISLPGTNGIEATRILVKKELGAKVVILSVHEKGEVIIDALNAGANGYVFKSQDPQLLFECLSIVASGRGYLDDRTAQVLVKAMNDHISLEAELAAWRQKHLTKREAEVLSLVANGHTNQKIATLLFISNKTVRNHLSHIYQKLDCADRTQAVLTAIRSGLIATPPEPPGKPKTLLPENN